MKKKEKIQIQALESEQVAKLTTIIKDLYESFYILVSNYRDYRFIPNDKEQKIIENFLLTLHSQYSIYSIGIDFLLTYFVFSFDRWQDKRTRFKAHIPIDWIIGKKAFEAWTQRNVQFMAYINDVNFVIRNKIDLKKIREKYSPPDSINYKDLQEIEDQTRRQYHNTIKGLQSCYLRTSLYLPTSEFCITCKNQTECRQIQKSTYPDIYKERHEQVKC